MKYNIKVSNSNVQKAFHYHQPNFWKIALNLTPVRHRWVCGSYELVDPNKLHKKRIFTQPPNLFRLTPLDLFVPKATNIVIIDC